MGVFPQSALSDVVNPAPTLQPQRIRNLMGGTETWGLSLRGGLINRRSQNSLVISNAIVKRMEMLTEEDLHAHPTPRHG